MLRPPRALKRRRTALAAALLAALLACGEKAERDATAPRATTRTRAAEEAAGPRLEVSRAADGSLRVRARQAPRLRVLQRLARTEGFAVNAGVGRPPARNLDLDLDGASLELVLEEVLGDVPHHLHYAPDAAADASVLRAVTVGLLPEAVHGEEPARAGGRRAGAASDAPRTAPARERERLAETLPQEEDVATLLENVARAPDPTVRAAAAEALGEVDGGEDSFRAGEALLEATHDRDPRVVAAAITALEEVHDLLPDPRFRERIATLAAHPDPRVREAVESFLEWADEDDW